MFLRIYFYCGCTDLKGLNPCAVFVFLVSGLAKNSAALTVIIKELDLKAVVIFISSTIVTSFLMGYLLNILWKHFDINILNHIMKHSKTLPSWINTISIVALLLAVLLNIIKSARSK